MLSFLQNEKKAKRESTRLMALQMPPLEQAQTVVAPVEYTKNRLTKQQRYVVLAKRTANGAVQNNRRICDSTELI
jgi:hypothetical protein